MEKTYTVAGVSKFNGVTTYRFTNIKRNLRANMLRHEGHTDIDLIELPKPMDRVHAVAYLIKLGKHGVIPTRAADKLRPNATLSEAEKLVARTEKAKATRLARAVAATAAVTPPAKKSRKAA